MSWGRFVMSRYLLGGIKDMSAKQVGDNSLENKGGYFVEVKRFGSSWGGNSWGNDWGGDSGWKGSSWGGFNWSGGDKK